MGVRDVLERDPDLAGAARLVDLLVDEADPAGDRALDAGQLQFRRHADGEPGERLLGHVGLEIDRSVLDDAEQRLARALEAAAPSLAERRLTTPATGAFTSVRSMRTRSSCRSASRLLRSASATPSAFWAAASWACAVFIAISRCSMVEAAMTPAVELARAVEIAGWRTAPAPETARSGSAPGRSPRRRAWSPRRSRRAARRAGVRSSRASTCPCLHPVAVLGVELDDREPVDAGRHLRFLARDQGARDEQPIDEFAFDRRNDGHRRRLDRARLIDRGRPAPGRRRTCPGRFWP